MSTPEEVVVGIDGSDGGQRAIRFALNEARLRHVPLHVVMAYDLPWQTYNAVPGLDVEQLMTDLREDAQRRLRDAVEAVSGESSGVQVTSEAIEGGPAQVLVARSAAAALLVVGSRGLGGFRGLLLGSVGHQCAQHARCPVVIVPAPHD